MWDNVNMDTILSIFFFTYSYILPNSYIWESICSYFLAEVSTRFYICVTIALLTGVFSEEHRETTNSYFSSSFVYLTQWLTSFLMWHFSNKRPEWKSYKLILSS